MMDKGEKRSLIPQELGENGFMDSTESMGSYPGKNGGYHSLSGPTPRPGGGYRRQTSQIKERITISWENLNVHVNGPPKRGCLPCRKKVEPPPPKHILKNATGAVEPGSLQVIMGASGSGKTTLLNCMTRRNLAALKITGEVRVNGKEMGEKISNISGYCQQEDLFIGTLKVSEHLWFHAKLRMDHFLTDEQRKARIEEVLLEMGMKKSENTFIGVPGTLKGLSGGEKKRLAFATELLRNPPLLFCDEPTSGLDSFMAQSVMEMLLELANRGRTILCTVHQPSSNVFSAFNKLLLMAEGRVAYMGSIKSLDQFFANFDMMCPPNYNPADFYIQNLAIVPGNEKECRKKVSMICDKFGESAQANRIKLLVYNNGGKARDGDSARDRFVLEMEEVEKNHSKLLDKDDKDMNSGRTYNASWWTQFKFLYWRCAIEAKRNKRVLPTRFFQILIASLIVGFIYFQQDYDQTGVQNINSALFLLMIQISFNTAFTIATSFAREFPVVLKEFKDSTYSTSPYYMAKVLVDIPVFLLAATAYTIVSYLLIGLNPTGNAFFHCWAGLVLMSLIAVAYGHMASALFPNPQLALTFLPFLLGMSLTFSGFLIKEGSISPVFLPLQSLSVYRYGYEVLLVNQWKGVMSLGCEHVDAANQYRIDNNITIPTNTSIDPYATSESSNWCYPVGESVIESYGYTTDPARQTGLYFTLAAFTIVPEILGFLALYLKVNKPQ